MKLMSTYIFYQRDAAMFRMNSFSVTYSRKTNQNYDYETTICGKLYDHTYFLKGKPLPLQDSGEKRVGLDGLNIIAGIFPVSFLLSF